MVCDAYLQKSIVKSKVPEKFCKRLNTFDDFWGCRFVWHPGDTQSGPPPGVVGQSGTLRTPKVVPTWGGSFIWHPKDTKNNPPPGGPVDFCSILARNGSGMDEYQHNLVKTARNFDASPAVTMGMRQDSYFVSVYTVSGSKRPGRRHGASAL